MLVPTTRSGRMPRLSSTRSTPMCERPLAPPPERTSAVRGARHCWAASGGPAPIHTAVTSASPAKSRRRSIEEKILPPLAPPHAPSYTYAMARRGPARMITREDRRSRRNDLCNRRGMHWGKGPRLRRRLPGGLHLRGRRSALHPSRRVHRLRRVRARVPGDRDLSRGGCAAEHDGLHREEQGSVQQRHAARPAAALTAPACGKRGLPPGSPLFVPATCDAPHLGPSRRRVAPGSYCLAATPEPTEEGLPAGTHGNRVAPPIPERSRAPKGFNRSRGE